MTTPLTDEQLSEIEAGLEGVTEGPWTVDQSGYRRSTPTVEAGNYYVCVTGPYDVRGEPRGQTATHIARLNPQTVAAWLARDKAQRAQVAELEAENKRLESELEGEDLPELKPSNFGLGQLVPDASKTEPTVGGFDRTTPPHWRNKEEK